MGIFDFRHIQIGLFGNCQYIDLGEKQRVFLAAPEIALLDRVYLEAEGNLSDYLLELRLENLERLDWHVIERLANLSGKPRLNRAVAEIRKLARENEKFESL